MHIKPLDNFYPDGLVFKTTWGFFDILIGCFATCLSSLLFKILPILLTLQVIVEIHFSSFFWIGILGVFEPNFKAIGKVYIPYKFVQRRHICIKTKEVFFYFQIFPNNLHLWVITCQDMSTLWKAWNTYANTIKQKHPAESWETQQWRLPKTINLYPIQWDSFTNPSQIS